MSWALNIPVLGYLWGGAGKGEVGRGEEAYLAEG